MTGRFAQGILGVANHAFMFIPLLFTVDPTTPKDAKAGADVTRLSLPTIFRLDFCRSTQRDRYV